MIFTILAAPHVRSMRMRRLNMTSFNISTSLEYTGGYSISHFVVQYRHKNDTAWRQRINVDAYSTDDTEQRLKWYGIVTHIGLGEPVELLVSVVNDAGHSTGEHSDQGPQRLVETLGQL